VQNAAESSAGAPCRKSGKRTLAVAASSSDDKVLRDSLEATVMSDTEPAEGHRAANLAWTRKEGLAPSIAAVAAAPAGMAVISFDRNDLREIFNLYGRKVSDGEWRDYAIDFTPQKAVFWIYRRACEYALYRIEKTPTLARKQGAYSVVTATGLVLKCGHDLRLVIAALDTRLKLVLEGTGGEVSFA
jgi:hypothetical protein